MTRLELETAIKRHLGNRADASAVLRIQEALNFGLKTLTKQHRWRDLRTETDLSFIRHTLSPALIDGTWTEATLTLVDTDSPFTAYLADGFETGDQLYVTDGTGVTEGYYDIASITDADTIVMSESIATDAAANVDGTKIGNFRKIELPSATKQMLSAILIDGTSSWEIKPKPKQWLIERYPNISSREPDKPIYGYIEKGWLYLYPLSGSEYTIRVTTDDTVVDFADDDAVNPLIELDLALVYWATGYVLNSYGEFRKAAVFNALSQEELEKTRSDDKADTAKRNLSEFNRFKRLRYGEQAYKYPFAWSMNS